MTLPTPDAQSPKSLSSYPRPAFVNNHSIPAGLSLPSTPPLSSTTPPRSETDSASPAPRARTSVSADFSHSWDLATGGLKTLTAKRELPQRQVRAQAVLSPTPTRSYMFMLVILACVVVMLISGGVVLFMTLQP